MFKKLLWSFLLMGISPLTFAQSTIEINPDKDNSIYSESSNSNGLGKLYSGQTCTDNSRRALLHFDIAGLIPGGVTVTDVTLTLNVDNSGVDASAEDYSIHAVTQDWGEGASSGTGTGAAAIAPDATWLDAMFGTEPWVTAGGDFNPVASATTVLTAVEGDYDWTGATMVSDVQSWLDDPSSNFGWILIGDEGSTCTARRFGSKDDGVAPILSITFTCGAPTAVCQNVNLYLGADGTATLDPEDLDGGSLLGCDGATTFESSIIDFNCDDIFTGDVGPSMVISAVYDGPLPGGFPKGVEVYVINDIEDLSIYGLGSANNGGGTDGEEFTFPAVSATAGQHIYVASVEVEFENWFGFAPDYTGVAMSINGDDAIELFMDGAVIDVFGDIDVDGTSEPWEYLDGWAYRISDSGPDGATFDIGNWTFSGINALDGESDNATAADPIPAGTYSKIPVGAIEVTLTVTNSEALSSTCTAGVTVLDSLAPVLACIGSGTFILDETGSLALEVADIDDGTTDGCGIDVLSLSTTEFSCADVGEQEVTLYATDIYGNIDSCTTTITIDGSETITIDGIATDPSCFGEEDGTIDITVSGGTPDYSFDWDNDGTGDFDDTEDLADLAGGAYEVTVEDANGCQSTALFELTEPEEIVITATVTNESCPGAMDGSIVIEEVTGGTAPYDIPADLTELMAGTYPVTVTDDNGCEVTADYEVGLDVTIDLTVSVDGFTLTAAETGATYQWVACPDYTPIDGATDQAYTATEVGSYAVIIAIDGGCSDTTDCIEVGFDNITEKAPLEWSIYPNPTYGVLNVQTNNVADNASIAVIDLRGQVVYKDFVVNTTKTIDLSHVETGVYFVQLTTGNTLMTKKVTISH